MGGYATTAVKTPYHAIKDEIYLWYLFMKDNADAYMLPIPIFTTASLLCRAAERDEIISSLTGMGGYPSNNFTGTLISDTHRFLYLCVPLWL
jgi:hypothetical protein